MTGQLCVHARSKRATGECCQKQFDMHIVRPYEADEPIKLKTIGKQLTFLEKNLF